MSASPLDTLPGQLHQQAASASLFDAFRDNGGPVLYTSMNRTAAIEDIRNIIIYVTFSTFFVAFLIIFPGIRKEVSVSLWSHFHFLITINSIRIRFQLVQNTN